MRKGNEVTLKEAIHKLLEVYKLRPKYNEAKINASWEKLMGPSVSKRTREIYIRKEKLFIKISSSVLREELMYSREKILSLVNEELGEEVVKEIVLL